MRNLFLKTSPLLLLLTLLFHVNVLGQTTPKADVVVKLNGDQLSGNVLEIADSTIKFSYTGEKLIYTIKKSEIQKIIFASGRTETVNEARSAAPAPATTAPAASTVDRRNKVAILPFSFTQDGQPAAPQVSEEIQNECYALLSKHAGVYNILSPRGTNVALAKAGINSNNMLNYTMADLCQILGVEYVIEGMVTQNRTSQTNYGNTTYNEKEKDKNKDDKKSSGTSSSYSTSTQNFQTVMDLKIYNDKSDIIYNQNRKAFWNTQDAYKNVLEYLIKRSPLYTK